MQAFRTGKQLPALINTFLEAHWAPVLQKIALKSQVGSTDWLTSLETMKDLTWSIEAKKAPDDLLKLISLLPSLLSRINAGLDSIEAPTVDRQAFCDKLVRCHSAALNGEPLPEPAPEATSEQKESAFSISLPDEGELLITRSVDNGVELEEVVLVGASPVWRADDREISSQVNELKRGDWVDFHDKRGGITRVRLNWISPQRGILVFSNHHSPKAISIDPDALARQIRDGRIFAQPLWAYPSTLRAA